MTGVVIEGVPNLRDLGGLRGADGRAIRPGRLYRAELLTAVAPNESNAVWDEARREEYEALGLALVVDLRSDPERLGSPSAWALGPGVQVVEIPIDDGAPGSATDLVAPILRGERSAFTRDDFVRYYATMLEGRGADLVRGVRAVADAGGRPALIHCSAGKDRTGVLVAMLLHLLGVDRAAIVADYARTGEVRPNRVGRYRRVFEERGIDPEAVRLMFETPADVFAAALDGLVARHGSVRGYLEAHGLTDEDVERLRSALLEDGSE